MEHLLHSAAGATSAPVAWRRPKLPQGDRSMTLRAPFVPWSTMILPSGTVAALPGCRSAKPSHGRVLQVKASFVKTSRSPHVLRVKTSFCLDRQRARPGIGRTVLVPILRPGFAFISVVSKDRGRITSNACTRPRAPSRGVQVDNEVAERGSSGRWRGRRARACTAWKFCGVPFCPPGGRGNGLP